eukprot:331655-Rhodomonas_salina.2
MGNGQVCCVEFPIEDTVRLLLDRPSRIRPGQVCVLVVLLLRKRRRQIVKRQEGGAYREQAFETACQIVRLAEHITDGLPTVAVRWQHYDLHHPPHNITWAVGPTATGWLTTGCVTPSEERLEKCCSNSILRS